MVARSRKNGKGRSKRTQRGPPPRTAQATPRLVGDVPRRQPVDQSTSSIRIRPPTGELRYRQVAPIQTFTVAAGAPGNPVITFALNGVAGSSTLTSLFDFYKIDAIRMTISSNNTAIGMVDPTTTALVPLYWVLDYNSAGVLASAAIATEYDNCMIVKPGERVERTFRPMYGLTALSSAGSDYVFRQGDWLTTTSDDILHYGTKFWIPAGTALQTFLQTWTVEIEYFFTFRQIV